MRAAGSQSELQRAYRAHAGDLAGFGEHVLVDRAIDRIVLDDVAGATFDRATLQRAATSPTFVLRQVTDFTARSVRGLPDTTRPTAENETL